MICISDFKHHNERLVRFFLEKAYPNGLPSIEELIEDNILSGTQLSELAVSKHTGIEIDSVGIGQDLDDKSDIKTCTVQSKRDNAVHIAPVRKIGSKNGNLRVIVFNPFSDRWHYFIIPHDVHDPLKSLNIFFNVRTGDTTGKYTEFEIFSWKEFCSE